MANAWDELDKQFGAGAAAAPAADPWAELDAAHVAKYQQPAAPAKPVAPTTPAKPVIKTVAELPKVGKPGQPDSSFFGDLAAGAVRGAGSIGATILWPMDKVGDFMDSGGFGDKVSKNSLSDLVKGQQAQPQLTRNEQRRISMDDGLRSLGANPDSMAFGAGKIGSEIAGTAGVGGLLAKGIAALPMLGRVAAPTMDAITSAVSTGGFKVPALAGLPKLGTRIAGGAINGAASAGLVDPNDAGRGGLIGAALPPALSGLGQVGGYAGRSVKSIVQPFTQAGQKDIAGSIIRKFADGGPTAINDAQLVAGSFPTLAEAMGNPGVSRLQSTISDMNPNAFSARQTSNSAARNTVFDDIAGDQGKLDYFKADRSSVANQLYGDAAKVDPMANYTPYIKGQVTQLLKRPSIDTASRQAQKFAMERGEKPSPSGSLAALHDTNTALGDMIETAIRDGQGGHAKALSATKDQLIRVIEKLSPGYAEARTTYAKMSQPINQMETLQGMRLTDATGNMTLSKVKNSLEGLHAKMNAPGLDPAKSITPEQVSIIQAIHDDLLRKANLNAGRSAGSNTFQNVATDNIISSILPGKIGEFAKGKVGGLLGQVGKLAYSGPNEAIKNNLIEMMLNPQSAQAAFTPRQIRGQSALTQFLTQDAVQQPLYRVAPLLWSDQ